MGVRSVRVVMVLLITSRYISQCNANQIITQAMLLTSLHAWLSRTNLR